MEDISHKKMITTLTLANAAELVAAVIKRVAGNDISTAINGQSLTKEALHGVALSRIRQVVKTRQA